jgi:hypothetical protein
MKLNFTFTDAMTALSEPNSFARAEGYTTWFTKDENGGLHTVMYHSSVDKIQRTPAGSFQFSEDRKNAKWNVYDEAEFIKIYQKEVR